MKRILLRTGAIALFCCTGCLPSFLRDPSLATYDDLVTVMNRADVPDRQLRNGMTRARLEQKLQSCLLDKPITTVKRALEKEGYECRVFRPEPRCLSEWLSISLERGILSCEKQPVHRPTETIHVDADDPELAVKMVRYSLENLQDVLEEILIQESILVRYHDGRVTQVTVD
jgi:hypothetical protein